ncbi:MAG: ATP-dependent Clp protease adaptor ClpS [Chloroflexi bacterium]|nr:ATP-dependent Clp protease adaptor ClpS [Chloroflexota bacterium]
MKLMTQVLAGGRIAGSTPFRSATVESGGEKPAEGGRAPAAPVRERDFDPDVLRRLFPPYKVVVLNNDHNTFDEVIRVLMRAVPGMTRAAAEAHANEIHLSGSTVPFTGPKERAEAVGAVIRTIGIEVRVEPDAT